MNATQDQASQYCMNKGILQALLLYQLGNSRCVFEGGNITVCTDTSSN